jgi:hypothetical protein
VHEILRWLLEADTKISKNGFIKECVVTFEHKSEEKSGF